MTEQQNRHAEGRASDRTDGEGQPSSPVDNDVHVFSRDMLDRPENWDSPWLVQFADGRIDGYETEEAACAFQRDWRRSVGLDPMTGAPLASREG